MGIWPRIEQIGLKICWPGQDLIFTHRFRETRLPNFSRRKLVHTRAAFPVDLHVNLIPSEIILTRVFFRDWDPGQNNYVKL